MNRTYESDYWLHGVQRWRGFQYRRLFRSKKNLSQSLRGIVPRLLRLKAAAIFILIRVRIIDSCCAFNV